MSKAFEVYRVEHRVTREGPFCPNKETSISKKMSDLTTNKLSYLKLPHMDGFPEIPFSYVFGCKTLQQLKQWILLEESAEANNHLVQSLRNNGFVVSMYVVNSSDVLEGKSGNQVAFYPYEAIEDDLLEQFDLNVLVSG